MNANEFAESYLEVWKVSDDGERSALMEKLFTEDAVHHISPADVSFAGRAEVEANIARVHKDNIAAFGLQFRVGTAVRNSNSIQLPWEIASPAGDTVKSGTDFFLLAEDGRISALYMFQS
ncbi:MAG: hypothetical protein QOI21_6255 [Actinomycetota bacterium]|jgi:hypothetical protein|nr:hypothetical protein [Actinomycetota bacterium]